MRVKDRHSACAFVASCVPDLLQSLQVLVLVLHCCQEDGGGQGREARQTQARFSDRERVLLTAHAAAYGSMALLKAPNFKLKSKSKVRSLTLKKRAKAFPSAVIKSCFHSPADNALCKVYQSPYDEEKMCNKCDAGWHLDCLNPSLATVLSGRWECRICTCIQSCPMKAHPAETGTKRDASKMTDESGTVFIDLTSKQGSYQSETCIK